MSGRPRRRKKSAVARLRPFWILLFLVAVALGAAAYYGASWPGFRPASVKVSGNRVVPAQEIVSRAAIARDRNVWLQNMGAAVSRIESIPYIGTAAIHRSFPSYVSIVVDERHPAAVLQAANGDFLIDQDLRVLAPAAGDVPLPRLSVPVIVSGPGKRLTDDRVARLFADSRTLTQAHVAVAEMHLDRFGDVVALMRDGIQLLLGSDSDIAQKSALVAPILSQTSTATRRVAIIDLRAPKTPVVRYK